MMAGGFKVDIDFDHEGLSAILEKLGALESEELLAAARKGMQTGLQRVRNDARANAPVDSSDLRQSIHTKTQIEGEALIGEVGAYVKHAVYVEFGTGPKGQANHADIAPEASAQVIYSPKGWTYPMPDGSFRYTEGMPARPFLYPAFKANQEKLKEDIVNAVMRKKGE